MFFYRYLILIGLACLAPTELLAQGNGSLFPRAGGSQAPTPNRVSYLSSTRVGNYNYDPTQFPDTFVVYLADTGYFFGQWREIQFHPPYRGRVTSGFGPRSLMGRKFHHGVDVYLRTGDTLFAAMDGVVRMATNDHVGYGKFVVLNHHNGLETLYGHLSDWLVGVGDTVQAGQPIALGGNTGSSTGPHLHFEFRFLGSPLDAERIVDLNTGQLRMTRLDITAAWFDYIKDPEAYMAKRELDPHTADHLHSGGGHNPTH